MNSGGVIAVPDVFQVLENGPRIIKAAINNLESTIKKAHKEGVDKKTISTVARLINLLEKIAYLFETVSKRLEKSDREIITLSPYTYVFKVRDEVILLRSRPEHVTLILNQSNNTVSLKTRNFTFAVTPGTLSISVRGKPTISVELVNREQLMLRKDELRTALNLIEKTMYRRLISYLEQRIAKRV